MSNTALALALERAGIPQRASLMVVRTASGDELSGSRLAEEIIARCEALSAIEARLAQAAAASSAATGPDRERRDQDTARKRGVILEIRELQNEQVRRGLKITAIRDNRDASAERGVDDAELSDAELIDELSNYRIQVADITQQLTDDEADDRAKGQSWRGRAKTARRGRQARILALEDEARKRNLIAAFPALVAAALTRQAAAERHREFQHLAEEKRAAKQAERDTQRALNQGAYDAAQRDRGTKHEELILKSWAEKTERIRLNAEANKNSSVLFVKAAHATLPRDVCDGIWQRVREMEAAIEPAT